MNHPAVQLMLFALKVPYQTWWKNEPGDFALNGQDISCLSIWKAR